MPDSHTPSPSTTVPTSSSQSQSQTPAAPSTQGKPAVSNRQSANPQTATPGPSKSSPDVQTKKPQTPETASPPPEKPPSDRKPLSYYLPLIAIVLGATLIAQLLLISIFGNNVKRQSTEQALAQQQEADERDAHQALTEHQDQIDLLSQSFPKLDGIREFVGDLNNQIQPYADKKLDISNNEPIQTKELFAPLLPVSLTVTATPSAFTQVISHIADSHYLFQPVYLEVNTADGLSQLGKIDYRGNLFVSKELLKTNL